MDSNETIRPLTEVPVEQTSETLVSSSATAEENNATYVPKQTKEEVIERLKEINEDACNADKQELDLLKQNFYKLHKAEQEAARKAFIDGGGAPEAFIPQPDDAESRFKDIMSSIKEKRSAIQAEQDKEKEEYLENNNIKYDILSSLDTDFTKEREYLNGYKDKENYDALETILKKHKINSHICTTMHNDYDYCLKKEHYIVLLTNEDLLVNEIINKISSGSIIYIPKTMKLVNLKLIISEIERQDLKIIYLSTLISEKI